jgi:putative DNA primase/helicase
MPTNFDDATLLNKARKAKDGAKFASLYDRGDWKGQGYPSQSEADLWLAGKLAFWAGRDSARIDSLFRQSALMRAKWNREDYCQRTLEAAIAGCVRIYQPNVTIEPSNSELHTEATNGDAGELASLPREDQADESADGPAVSASWSDEDNEPDPPAKYSDIALSNHFADLHGGNLRYLNQIGEWFVYSERESLWAQDEKMLPWTLTKRMLAAVAKEAYDEVMNSGTPDKSKALKLASAIASAAKVAAVVNLARSHKRIAATMRQFDRDPWLLNTPDGVVNLRDGKLRPALRADYFTKITVVAPRRMATPVFNQFMFDIMGEHVPIEICRSAACAKSVGKPEAERKVAHKAEVEALVAYIQRVYGYALTGDVCEHALFIEVGEGGNGKGVLNDLISEDIMGTYPSGYSCNVPIEALLVTKGERHPTELMDLWNSRFALARESDEGTRWNDGRIKLLTGGDRIKAPRMRQNFVEFPPTHKLMVFGNAKPTLRGADQSAWKRRLHFIMFPQKWADEPNESKNIRKADKELRDKLRAEAPGILQILIDRCLERSRLKGFNPPLTVREATDTYLYEQNVIAQWMAERCDVSNSNNRVTANELWADCSAWAESRMEYVGKRKDFNDRLERAGVSITRTGNQRGICQGIKLKTEGSVGSGMNSGG